MTKLLFTLIFVFLSLNLYAQENYLDNRGPLETRGYTLFQLSSSELLVPTKLYMSESSISLNHSVTWSNIFNVRKNDTIIMDYEILRIDNKIWYGITDRLQVGFSLPINIVGGGSMDGLVEGFHRTFGLGDDRALYERDKFIVNNEELNSEMFVGDLTLHARYRLFDNPGISFGLKLQSPSLMTTDWYNHSQFGVGLDTVLFWHVGDLFISNAFNVARVGDTDVFGFETKPMQYSYVACIDWKLMTDVSVILQFTATSGQAEYLSYNKWTYEVTGGFRINISDNYTIDFGMLENILTHDNTIDVAFYLGLTFKK